MTPPRRDHLGSARRSATGGFTLVELLTVVMIIGVLSMVAVFAINRNTAKNATSRFASQILNAFKEARSRAQATGKRYVVQIKTKSVQWCEEVCPAPAGKQKGPYLAATMGAQAVKYAKAADIGIGARPALTNLADITVTFLPNGSVDSDPTTAIQEGITIYLQDETDSDEQVRVAVIPLSGDVRKYNSWD